VCLGFGDEQGLDPAHHLLSVPCKVCDCATVRQPGAECLGFVTRPSWVVSRRYCTLHNAICNRHGKCRPAFSGDFSPFEQLSDELVHELKGLYDLHIDHYREEWINKWPLKKRDAIRFEQATKFVSPSLVKLFAKYEGGHSRPTKGRGIQMYYDLATQALWAPSFTSLQKAFAMIFNGREFHDVSITFASGMTHGELGRWMDDTMALGDCVFYERDGKNWDATMARPHHDLKNLWYRKIVGDEFADFVDSCYEVKGSARTPHGLFKYKLSGTTKSGHNDTTLGNSLINAAISYCAMKTLGLRGRIIVAGDDCLVAVYGTRQQAEQLAAVEATFGIVPEAKVFDHWSEVSFISGVWYPSPSGFCFGPKLGRLLARLFWTTKCVPKRKRVAWRHSVATGMLQFFGDVPILRAWLQSNVQIGCKVIAVDKLSADFAVVRGGMLVEFLCQKYEISTADVIETEAFIMSLPSRPGYVSHPVLDKIMSVDLADVFDRPTGRVNL